jgi:leader peptidase (prepilin peptidase)/N-methyltransferase
MMILAFVLGIVAGILINRAADNLPPPAERSLLATPRCPHCNMLRTPIQQSGVLSFVLRRDKCRHCGAPVSLRAPLVEIGTAALFAFLAQRYPFGIYLVAVCFFTAVLVLIAIIDIEHKLILNVISLPATVLALAASPILLGGPDATPTTLKFNALWFALLGGIVGYVITLGIYYLGALFLRALNRGRSQKINTVAFGMGDVKLAGLLGALIGFPAIVYALIWAILLGGVGAALVILFRLVTRRGYSAFMAIPYGPYLILAGGAFLIFGSELLRRAMGM